MLDKSLMLSLEASILSIFEGIRFNSSSSVRKRDCGMLPLSRAMHKAIMVNTQTCAVNAFVEATPISGPTCVYEPE